MVVELYFIIFVLSLLVTGRFLYRNKTADAGFMLFGMIVSLNSLGRIVVATSEGLETALLGNFFLYIGGCFAPLVMIILLSKISGIRIPKFITVFLGIYSTIIVSLVYTIGENDFYYKRVSLVKEDGYSYLVKEYGIAHKFYTLLVAVYALMLLYFIIRAIKEREHISLWTVSLISGTGLAIIITYILERIIGSGISYLSIGYLIAISIMIHFFERLNMYDMSTIIIGSIEKMKEYGYIVLDTKQRYISSNDYMKEIFPVVKTWKVDFPVPYYDHPSYREIMELVENFKDSSENTKIIQLEDKYLEVRVRMLTRGKKDIGLLLEFIDRTIEKRYYNTIEDYNESLSKEVEEKTRDILRIKDMMVLGLAELVEGRDTNTGGHIKRTSHVIRILIETIRENKLLFLDKQFCRDIIKAAPMHDLGKISIDDKILRKPGRLTAEEFEIIKTHAAKSAELVENILRGVEEDSFIQVAVNVARYHHEKWNGTGYPEGLSGSKIPIEARIMAVADVYDALVSKRCYKKEMDFDKAAEVMMKSMGTHFDPALERLFVLSRKKLETYYSGIRD